MSDKPEVHVYDTDTADTVRVLYEVPEALARCIQPEGEERTFCECLEALLKENR